LLDIRTETAGIVSSGRAGSDAAFLGAQRHSRRVRMLRIAVPIAATVGVIALALTTFLNPLRFMYKLPNDLGTLVVSGTKITMEAPRLAGFTRDSRGYEVHAKSAAQDLANPEIVELKELRAKIDMQDKTNVEMTAQGGFYNTKSELLTLGPDILLKSTTGYEARLADAVVDIRKGNIVSDKPVAVKMLKGNLDAKRIEVLNAGEVLRFDGGVSMTLYLDRPAAPAAAAQVRAEAR
jgi:lipopolysaccharide export system protein LptC